MNGSLKSAVIILGVLIAVGFGALGYQLANGLLQVKSMERTVNVKGLAEREMAADIAIWPIKFSDADNDLGLLYSKLQNKNTLIIEFLQEKGFTKEEMSVSSPAIVDRQALSYGDASRADFRFTGRSTITVYTKRVEQVRSAMSKLVELGKQGVAITGEDEGSRPEFVFSGLNLIKPAMIEEATKNARQVAEKFASDSGSQLGKIKVANQGQFNIQDRDNNTPHIKKIRIVSTIEYYLID